MRARSQSCWNKYSDRHTCRALVFFVCAGWELLNSALEAVNFPSSLAYFDLKQVKSKQSCTIVPTVTQIQWINTTLGAFINDSLPVRQQLCFTSLLRRADGGGLEQFWKVVQRWKINCNIGFKRISKWFLVYFKPTKKAIWLKLNVRVSFKNNEYGTKGMRTNLCKRKISTQQVEVKNKITNDNFYTRFSTHNGSGISSSKTLIARRKLLSKVTKIPLIFKWLLSQIIIRYPYNHHCRSVMTFLKSCTTDSCLCAFSLEHSHCSVWSKGVSNQKKHTASLQVSETPN